MKNERLKKLLEWYRKKEQDPFIIYGIALEYLKIDPQRSTRYFDILLKEHPSYLPAYYQAARHYAEIGELKQAAIIYQKGIALAEKLREHKTKEELLSAYRELKPDMD